MTAILWCLTLPAHADVSVTGAVDRNRFALGESITFTIAVSGTQQSPQPAIPTVAGLRFDGPALNTSVTINNGAMSQSVQLAYQISATRTGQFVLPAIPVTVAGKEYRTAPIALTVLAGETPEDTRETLFAQPPRIPKTVPRPDPAAGFPPLLARRRATQKRQRLSIRRRRPRLQIPQ
jgi:hypothetical protein